MTFKNKLTFFAILCFIFVGFASCSDDSPIIDPPTPIPSITLDDVVLQQAVNGEPTFSMTAKDEELTYSSQIGFANKQIDWTNPVLEQSLNEVLEIAENKITVTNAEGAIITAAVVKVASNKVEVSFTKANGSYSYMSDAKFKLNIVATLKSDVTDEELKALVAEGFSSQSIFYVEGETKQVKSNLVTVYPPKVEEGEDIYEVGDPRNSEYKYKLNVVYFVPSDLKENADYKRRISGIFFSHQRFVRKWMTHWGYGDKSYGLSLDEDGLVDIVLVKAAGVKANYPYDGSAPKIIDEIKKHYADNKLSFLSEHTLIITAVNEDLAGGIGVPSTPFYGYGRHCFALDYPGMSQEAMGQGTAPSHVATVWIGGMLHELGHGMNLPHVGPTNTHLNDSNFGTPLMGKGNRTYGETPTFLQESSAAILNNCQITSFVEKTFYQTTTGSVNISDIIIDGDKCTVKGNFEASMPVTDVIVRFHNASEAHLGPASGYTSVGFYVKPNADKTFEKVISIADLKVNLFDYKVGVSILLENGTTKNTLRSDIYRQENNTLVNLNLDNSKWTATASHAYPPAAVPNNNPNNLVDGDGYTLLALVKPDRTYDDITIPATDQVFVTIDLAEQVSYDVVVLTYRQDLTIDYLRVKKVSLYGSNDGAIFEVVKENNVLDVTKSQAIINLPTTTTYRYIKMTYDDWHESGLTMQFAEIALQKK